MKGFIYRLGVAAALGIIFLGFASVFFIMLTEGSSFDSEMGGILKLSFIFAFFVWASGIVMQWLKNYLMQQ